MYLVKIKMQQVKGRTYNVKTYKDYVLIRIRDTDVYGNYYWEIWKNDARIAIAWTFENAIEFIDSGENHNVLC